MGPGESGSGGRVVSVSIAEVREIPYSGGTVQTGIWKLPVEGRVAVGTEGSGGGSATPGSTPSPGSSVKTKMGHMRFVKRFAKALRLGAFPRVIEEGALGAGDAIDVVERPAHDVTVQLVGRVASGERELAAKALEAPALSDAWRGFLEENVARAG